MQMIKYHEYSLQKIEAMRIFNLIQQMNPESDHSLSVKSINNFNNVILPGYQTNVVKNLHEIDFKNREFTQQYFGQCISLALQSQKISTRDDLFFYHEQILNLLCGRYVKKFQSLDKWDGIRQNQDQIKYNINKLQNQYKCGFKNFLNADIMNTIDQVHFYLSIVTLDPYLKQDIKSKLITLLNNTDFITVLQKIFYKFSNQPNFYHPDLFYRSLQCLCYLYNGLRYEEIQKLLKQIAFLFNPDVWTNYYCQNYRIQLGTIKPLSIIFALLARYSKEFCQYILNEDLKVLRYISSVIIEIKKPELQYCIPFCIQFYINIVRHISTKPIEQQITNKFVLDSMLFFGFDYFKNKQMSVECKSLCLKLIRETIKLKQPMSEQQMNQFLIFSQIFISKIVLIQKQALSVLQEAIRTNSPQIVNFIIESNTFMMFLERTIKKDIDNQQNDEDLHFQSLNILYLLSISKHANFLFENNCIERLLLKLIQSTNNSTVTIVSYIITNLIQNSLNVQWKIASLYQHNILFVLSVLLNNNLTFIKIQDKQYRYFGKQIVINTLKSIYMLGYNKKTIDNQKYFDIRLYFVKNFNVEFINNFKWFIQNVYKLQDDKILWKLFNTDIVDNEKKNRKIYYILHRILQNMRQTVRQKEQNILQFILKTKKLLYEKLYSMFTTHDLQINQIPIYFNFTVIYNQYSKQFSLSKVQWNSLKNHISSIYQPILRQKIENFKAFQIRLKKQIKTQADFRQIISSVYADFVNTKFGIFIEITNILQRSQVFKAYENPQLRAFDRINNQSFRSNKLNNQYQSLKVQGNYKPTRAYTPNNLTRNTTKSFNIVDDRDRSSYRGNNLHPCRQCRKMTYRPQLCDTCSLRLR